MNNFQSPGFRIAKDRRGDGNPMVLLHVTGGRMGATPGRAGLR